MVSALSTFSVVAGQHIASGSLLSQRASAAPSTEQPDHLWGLSSYQDSNAFAAEGFLARLRRGEKAHRPPGLELPGSGIHQPILEPGSDIEREGFILISIVKERDWIREKIRREVMTEARIRREITDDLVLIRDAQDWQIFAEIAGELWGVQRLQFVKIKGDGLYVGREEILYSGTEVCGSCTIGPNGEFVANDAKALKPLRRFFGPHVEIKDLNNPDDSEMVTLRYVLESSNRFPPEIH